MKNKQLEIQMKIENSSVIREINSSGEMESSAMVSAQVKSKGTF